MSSERSFRVHIQRRLDAEDEAAIHQAGVELVPRTDPDSSAGDVLLIDAADEEQARLRVHAALGGHEDLDIRPSHG